MLVTTQGPSIRELFPGGSASPPFFVLPFPLAATHLQVPHPPGAAVFTMLCVHQCLTQVDSLWLQWCVLYSQSCSIHVRHNHFGRVCSILTTLKLGVVARLR